MLLQQICLYEALSSMSFISGYIDVLITVSQDTKVHILSHLKELIVDGETSGWQVVLNYHTKWLQHIEQCGATWRKEPTKLRQRMALV